MHNKVKLSNHGAQFNARERFPILINLLICFPILIIGLHHGNIIIRIRIFHIISVGIQHAMTHYNAALSLFLHFRHNLTTRSILDQLL